MWLTGACCTKLCFEFSVFQARDLLASSSPVLIAALLSFCPQKGKSLVPSCLQGVDNLVSSQSHEHSQPTCCSRQRLVDMVSTSPGCQPPAAAQPPFCSNTCCFRLIW